VPPPRLTARYINVPTITNPAEIEDYIVPPVAGDAAGLMGALQLGLMARNAAPAAGLGQVLAKKRAMLANANPCVLMCVAAAAGALAMHLARR
jgi:hypothetical protein